ncbi:glycerate kinase [Pararoseomonas sp. SCSIO 73927]|uniref:glycerate kinase family protein n=1 Tax=Pararoseomonas sp. SCSIO 73927 TaxID=3114537 RepID=UPI0030D4293F
MQPLRILVAPSGYKECLYAAEVAEAIRSGLARALPGAQIVTRPVVDGGEGFARGLALASGGRVEPVTVTGPVGEAVTAGLGWLGDRGEPTAVIEMASAAGLRLVPRDRRDPLATTSRGVGELIRAALDRGARRILLGCGDSGTCDAGLGMAAALGFRFLDRRGGELPAGGGALARLARIEVAGRDPRLAEVPIEVACNMSVPLTGPAGAARGFGPQKGATPAQVDQLEAGIARFIEVAGRDLGATGLAEMAGAGASGGLGAGLHALLGARLRPWQEVVLSGMSLDREIARADLVVTAEGGIDGGTPRGKIPAIIAGRARAQGVPVIALAGCVGPGVEAVHGAGIDALFSTLGAAVPLPEAVRRAPADIERAAEQALRGILVGMALSERRGRPAREPKRAAPGASADGRARRPLGPLRLTARSSPAPAGCPSHRPDHAPARRDPLPRR